MPSKVAYFIMPAGSDRDFETKLSTFEACLQKAGWVAHFPSTAIEPQGPAESRDDGFNLSAMITEMKSADLVVADLSLQRPSCYYELGVAQAIGCPTFLVAAAGTPIHQAANREQIHFYKDLGDLSSLIEAAFSS